MNSYLVLALFLASSVPAITGTFTEDMVERLENAETGETLARLILSRGVLQRLEEALVRGYEPRLPVFPNATEDPYELKDIAIHIPFSSDLKDLIYGNLSLCSSSIEGLRTFTYNSRLVLLPFPIRLQFQAKIGDLLFHGLHGAELELLYFMTDLTSTLVGTGEYALALKQGVFDLEVSVSPDLTTGGITIPKVTVDLGFTSLTLNSAESAWNGEPVNWDSVNRDIKTVFDTFWPVLKNVTETALPKLATFLVQTCKIADLIKGDFSCIGDSGVVVESFSELFTVEEELIEQCLNTTATLPPITAGPTTTERPTTTEIPETTTTGEEEPKPTEASAPSTIVYSYTLPLLVISAVSTSLLA